MVDADARVNIGVRLLPAAVAKLDAAAERTGRSRAAVLEVLISLHAGELTAETPVPFGLIPADSRAKKKPTGTARGGKTSPTRKKR